MTDQGTRDRETDDMVEQSSIQVEEFDPVWYLHRYVDVAKSGFDPLEHFAQHGRHEGRFPNAQVEAASLRAAEVDPIWYLNRYPDVADAGADARNHYASYGHADGRYPNAKAEAANAMAAKVDPIWYRARYPDVAEAGMDPKIHFAKYGYIDSRFPNAEAEAFSIRAAEVDPAWYLARYRDVAASGTDPRLHYAEYGHVEGRYPNAAVEPRQAWDSIFDPAWYSARYLDLGEFKTDPLHHFRTIGILEGRAPNAFEDDREAWKTVFDEAWYLDRNTDVADAGLDPLEHFIRHGLLERRRPNKNVTLPGSDVTATKITCLKAGRIGREVALFVTWSAEGTIKPHVAHYAASLKQQGIDCILIVTSDHDKIEVPETLAACSEVIYQRANGGFDFAAWAHVFRLQPELFEADIVYLINDSVFGPTSETDFGRLVVRIRETDADLIGLTDNLERGWHIQSYFLVVKQRALKSQVLRDFIHSIVSFDHKDDVINEYETQFTRQMMRHGLRCESMFPTPGLPNSTLHRWRELLDVGFPFIKVSTVRGLSKGTNLIGWREATSLQGYDTAPADRTLAEMAARTVIAPVSLAARKFNHRQQARAELHAFFATRQTIDLPVYPDPVISVLMVVYNEAELTFRALQSIVATVDLPVEVIIVDNASTDDTRYLLDRVRNARMVRNVEDLHFLRAANQAAARAKGRALLFLNNDISLQPDAVRYGLETLESSADVAVVGAKLVLTDGTLQEAGSIIWSDGACLGYGRGQSPDGYQYNFRRDVDYCSGAYMMMRRDVFEQLGRFDTIYAPAYYEETDLCMRIHAAGFRVIYDPRIVVNHYEFASVAYAGEASALMGRNFKTFSERHHSALARRHLPQTSPTYLARSRHRHLRRILMIDNLVPLSSHGAGFPRTSRILDALTRQGFFVTYYPTFQPHVSEAELRSHCSVDVEFVLGSDRPVLTQLIEERPGYYDGIFVCRPNNMHVIQAHFLQNSAPYRGTALIYDAEAVCAPRDARRRAIHGNPMTPAEESEALAAEIALSDIADLTLVVNEWDAGYFRDGGRSNVGVLGHALEIKAGEYTFAQRQGFLFVGRLDDDTSPNVDALFWFIERVMPKLDGFIGSDYRLIVAGPTGSARLVALDDPRIQILGRVDDLTPHYDAARVFIGPTRYAAGIPLKIYEAAAFGVPTVITPLLADQLGWVSGEAALIGSDESEFAEQCGLLYQDEHTWNAVRDSSLLKVRKECAPAEFECRLAGALHTIGLRP
ncbi:MULTISPECIES: glycosyltransferase [unclassified Methylobacterium]|uniref:glycosyltransferase n=1 Tax=unclassified Methylobacterium TaxID=2615210 RepID=UPI0011C1EBFA|nr:MULTISPECIES: glycosyltransferase [unclassified Methylobacterium]QEE39056.1 glycosyltransferase [Methylobacterium sp. WL1]TXN56737.1 glycosyltransferase [Methylobacterium sp. WL2]